MKKILTTYLVLMALMTTGQALTFTTYVVYMLSKGLTLFEANASNAVYFITVFLFEIPTGVFADRYKKKYSIVAGAIFNMVGLSLFVLADDFGGFILAEIIFGIGSAFISGAGQAWLVNESKYIGYDFDTHRSKLFKKVKMTVLITGVFAGLIGAWIAESNLVFPWIVATIIYAFVVLMSLSLKEHSHISKKEDGVKTITQEGFKLCWNNSNLRFSVLLVSVFSFAIMSVNMLWQPFVKDLAGGISELGYLWAVMATMMTLGAWLSDKALIRCSDERKLLLMIVSAIGTLVLIAGFCGSYIAVIFLVLHQICRGLYMTLIDSFVQGNSDDKYRATIGSITSFAFTFAGSLGLLVSGFLSEQQSIEFAWIFSGGILLLGSTVLWKFFVRI